MPFGNSKNFRNHAVFSSPNSSMPTQSSMPLNTAQNTIMRISFSLWSLSLVSRRGAARLSKIGARIGQHG
jgi:hypothetical protein